MAQAVVDQVGQRSADRQRRGDDGRLLDRKRQDDGIAHLVVDFRGAAQLGGKIELASHLGAAGLGAGKQ